MCKKYAIVCGSIRNDYEFLCIVYKLLQKRNESLINEIIVSTWEGDFSNKADLQSILHKLNIKVIENPSVPDNYNTYFNMSYLCQSIQLSAALKNIPNDALVLKCRTDYCLDELQEFFEMIPHYESSLLKGKKGGVDKILVKYIGLSAPFIMNDQVYCGYRKDLIKLVQLAPSKVSPGYTPIADSCFFEMPFIQNIPVVSQFIEKFNYWEFNDFIRSLVKCEKGTILPNALLKLYSVYFKIVKIHFIAYNTVYSPSPIKFRDIFCNLSKNGIEESWIKIINDTRLIEDVVDLEDVSLESEMLTDEDLNELSIFIDLVTNYKSDRIIKKPPIIDTSGDECNPVDVFSQYTDSQSRYKFIEIVNAVTQNDNFYQNSFKKYAELSICNEYLGELALIASSRSRSSDILYILSKKLLENKISSENVSSAEFVFKRYGLQDTMEMFFMPQSTKQLLANTYFSLYYSDKMYESRFINNFCQYYIKLAIVPNSITDLLLVVSESLINDPQSVKNPYQLSEYLIEVCKDLDILPDKLLYNIGRIIHYGVFCKVDLILAKKIFDKIEEDRDVIFQKITTLWDTDSQESSNEMICYIQSCIDKGEGLAVDLLADAYRMGKGVAKDTDKAIELKKKAIDMGIFWARNSLFDIYWEEKTTKYDAILLETIRPILEGNNEAMHRLSKMYYHGRGIKMDRAEAKRIQKSIGFNECPFQ